MKNLVLLISAFVIIGSVHAAANDSTSIYQPNWKSIDSRPLPAWFNEAKFGIFVVWGPYSVPSWVPEDYAEWYGHRMSKDNRIRDFHVKNYGADFKYEDFAPLFKAELWNPDQWCDLFAKSGAKYVVTTANYHDGFAMFPTKYARTVNTDQWNSMVTGPKRDIIGELNEAGQKYGLKMGIYYSLYEWWHGYEINKFVDEQFHPKFKEVVTKYKPWFIFLDGEWGHDSTTWKTPQLAAWLYNESPAKDYVITNDRWGNDCRGKHGDIYSSEYGAGEWCSTSHPWQEDRGIGRSYGYNRNEDINAYDSSETLIRMFSKVVGGGGNYLLCVGPTADGRIPVIMQERLMAIGRWLKLNGEAIYATTGSPFWPRKFDWGTISVNPGCWYLHVHDPLQDNIVISDVNMQVKNATLLSKRGPIPVEVKTNDQQAVFQWNGLYNDDAVTIIKVELQGEPKVDKTQHQYQNGDVLMTAHNFDLHGDDLIIKYEGARDCLYVAGWKKTDYLLGEFVANQPGQYIVEVTYVATPKEAFLNCIGSKVVITVDGTPFDHTVQETGGIRNYKTFRLGTIMLDKPGRHLVKIQPKENGTWNGFPFQSLTLKAKTGLSP